MRRLFPLSLFALAVAIAPTALGQNKPHRRLPPAPIVQTQPPVQSPKPAAAFLLRAVSPSPVDPGPTCRAQCSKDRYSCHGEDDATDCNARWLTCLSTCRKR